jgi:dTDP-4-dehydrorhamnose reductase
LIIGISAALSDKIRIVYFYHIMTPAKTYVTGAAGQLGGDLVRHFQSGYDVIGVDIADFDITDKQAVMTHLQKEAPDIVLHAAAYTDVDGCESNAAEAMRINSDGTAHIAEACRALNAKLVYYSTDYVFSGKKTEPYIETDPTEPNTVYGQSKLAGEKAVFEFAPNCAALRIAWVYGINGNNFVKMMINLGARQLRERNSGQTGAPLTIVDDQIGNPTWTEEIARQTEIVIQNNLSGVFHGSAEGQTTWRKFAESIFERLSMDVNVIPCATSEFPRPAPRPANSAMENKALKALGLNRMADWDEALSRFLEKYGEQLRDGM